MSKEAGSEEPSPIEPTAARSSRFLVAVAALVFRGDRVLAMRRAHDNEAGAGLWEVVSGRLHPGEDLLDALAREVVEETQLTVRVNPEPVDAYAMARGSEPLVLVLYRADWLTGEVVLSAEHDAFEWWTPAELRERSTLSRLADAIDRAAARGV
jgi:8-oxo-dGTP pyrophosphatase MutT (NUDIX family)